MTIFARPGISIIYHVISQKPGGISNGRLDHNRNVLQQSIPLVLLVFFASFSISSPVQAQSDAQAASPENDFNALWVNKSIAEVDAFIGHTFTSLEIEHFEAATNAYLWLLEQAGASVSKKERLILDRHFSALAMVMSAADRNAIGLGEPSSETLTQNLIPAYANAIALWWRRQDNLPATPLNERIEEHLRRVTYAHVHFANKRDPRGLDDRGEIFIRLGEPSKNEEIKLLTPSLIVNAQSFSVPKNTFWVYQHIENEAHYLFVRKSKAKGFVVSESTDLIPHQLQGRRYINELLVWMEEIYGQLALLHNSYGLQFDEITNYLAIPNSNIRADVFARTQLSKASVLDDQNAYLRSQIVPSSYSSNFGVAENLNVHVRMARFLNEDASTRSEVYWSMDNKELAPSRKLVRNFYKQGHEPSERYLISAALTHLSDQYEVESLEEKHFLVKANLQRPLPAKTLEAHSDQPTFHLALQWDQRWTLNNEDPVKPGARVKIGTHRIDSLQALHAEGLALEMSDLKPLITLADFSLDGAQAYASPQISNKTPLALYFEIYNLTFDQDDNTQYSIEYEVVREQGRRFFNFRTPEGVSSARITNTGNSRAAKEFIIPELYEMDGKGKLEIIIHVTDLTSGAKKSRSIEFELKN
ncbi:MAG: GWxTD domain-containing protein [Rhodothermales bacterium]